VVEKFLDVSLIIAISRELNESEQVLWTGTPNAQCVMWRASCPGFLLGLVVFAFGLFILTVAYSSSERAPDTVKYYDANGRPITDPAIMDEIKRATNYKAPPEPPVQSSAAPLGALLLIVTGIVGLASPIIAYQRASNTTYAVTDLRLIVVDGLRNRTRSYTHHDIGPIERVDRDNATGDIRLRGMMPTGYRRVPDYLSTGLVCIDNVREVEQMLLNLGNKGRES
jgi:hypothetical protein